MRRVTWLAVLVCFPAGVLTGQAIATARARRAYQRRASIEKTRMAIARIQTYR